MFFSKVLLYFVNNSTIASPPLTANSLNCFTDAIVIFINPLVSNAIEVIIDIVNIRCKFSDMTNRLCPKAISIDLKVIYNYPLK
jgi:hypothetical protein